ncbi:hypothetical protein HMPREF9710_01957 [Massilia timonae CCUG 45783]|uniref:Uncharacterized protein n=1 Tax=Massilia timonae CCUG 45783 TaxID=883126 RepID=K9E019_9BURK|nr:hypothetical protein HMPREF9710_01957 [Massilia timonae CCUG 45783]
MIHMQVAALCGSTLAGNWPFARASVSCASMRARHSATASRLRTRAESTSSVNSVLRVAISNTRRAFSSLTTMCSTAISSSRKRCSGSATSRSPSCWMAVSIGIVARSIIALNSAPLSTKCQ